MLITRLFLSLLALAILIISDSASPARVYGQGGGAAPIVVSEAIERPVAAQQTFVANINANRRTIVGSAVDGRMEALLVDAGQAIKKGDPISQLRTRAIEIQIAGAVAERDLRAAELKQLQTGSRPEEIKLAEAQLDAAKAAFEYAQARLKRAESLYRTGSGLSEDEFDEAKSIGLRAAAQKREAESNLSLVREGPRTELIDQALAKLAVQEQEIAGLEDRLEKFIAKSPFNGFVVREFTEVGAWIKQGDPLAEIVEADPLEVEVFVPESSIRFLRPGTKVEVHVDAVPQRSFTGEIEQVVPNADMRARTFPVHVRLANVLSSDNQYLLYPGMSAKVTLPVSDDQPRVLVPKDALTLNRGDVMVAKVTGKIAVPVPVKIGPTLGGLISVESLSADVPLRVGDIVVIRGNERLRFGNPTQPPAVEILETVPAESFLETKP